MSNLKIILLIKITLDIDMFFSLLNIIIFKIFKKGKLKILIFINSLYSSEDGVTIFIYPYFYTEVLNKVSSMCYIKVMKNFNYIIIVKIRI